LNYKFGRESEVWNLIELEISLINKIRDLTEEISKFISNQELNWITKNNKDCIVNVENSRGPITIYPGSWLQNDKNSMTKSKIAIWIRKTEPFKKKTKTKNYSLPSSSETVSSVKAVESL
jgi:hypothetical protein